MIINKLIFVRRSNVMRKSSIEKKTDIKQRAPPSAILSRIKSSTNQSPYQKPKIGMRLDDSMDKLSKTVSMHQIKELAEKHYNKAMKYVYKKNEQHKQMIQKQENKMRPEAEVLTKEHVFNPQVRQNKYSKKIDEMKDNKAKYVELRKWGVNHTALRRQQVIRGQISQIRSSLQKQKFHKSLENSRSLSIGNSSIEKEMSTSIRSKDRVATTEEIPGVRKYLLNQAKAQVSKVRHQQLFFRGNEAVGYYF